MRFLNLILSLLMFLTAFAGDYLVFKSKYSDSFVFRACTDSLVHGFIGFLSAATFFSHKLNLSAQTCVLNTLFCTFMSSVIDVDHVFVAKSFQLKDLANLSQRGILHCTTFWTIITSALLLYAYLAKKLNSFLLTFMLILAFTSHHIRDGNRRGLWVYPYGHTSPINKYLYAILLTVLPNVLAYVYVMFKRDFIDCHVDYTNIV